MTSSRVLSPAPANFVWPQCPEADEFVNGCISNFLSHHSFAKGLSERMLDETSTHFSVWVDHLILPADQFKSKQLENVGYEMHGVGYWHPTADLPWIVLSKEARQISCAIHVESISDFQMAHQTSFNIEGVPLGEYRRMKYSDHGSDLWVIERRGGRTFVPDQNDTAALYIEVFEIWASRPRIDMKESLKRAQQMVQKIGVDRAAWIFLEVERKYWQAKNKAGKIQKSRQDQLGLGWANHDHHTFRSSRSEFLNLLEILFTFGFKKRERFYAGKEAGWGAQVMEQPNTNLIIFADVDLTAEDAILDFSERPLPAQPKPGTVGLWCALHGESMLEAGMHHLEAQFDFDHLKTSLKLNQIEVMKPFSDFPYLRQAFTKGEQWCIPEERINQLIKNGWLSVEAAEKIKEKGAVGSHLENLQRKNGFKGFNQRGVSDIILEVNPEKQALG